MEEIEQEKLDKNYKKWVEENTIPASMEELSDLKLPYSDHIRLDLDDCRTIFI